VSTVIISEDLLTVIILWFLLRILAETCNASCLSIFPVLFFFCLSNLLFWGKLMISCGLPIKFTITLLQIVPRIWLQESFWNRLQRIQHLNNETFGQMNLLTTATTGYEVFVMLDFQMYKSAVNVICCRQL
jgi:hypothetical protein